MEKKSFPPKSRQLPKRPKNCSPSHIIGAPRWTVSYSGGDTPEWLAYLIDCHIHRCLDEGLPSWPKFIPLGTAAPLGQKLGLRSPLTSEEIAQALRQNMSITVEIRFEAVDDRGSRMKRTHWFCRYQGSGTPGPPEDPAATFFTIEVAPEEGWFRTYDARPVNRNYQRGLPPASKLLYEWLSYRLYAAALQGYATAPIRYSNYCRYASLRREISAENVRTQMEALQEPHFRSGYLAEVAYESGPLTAGLPDWMLVYTAGPSAKKEFVEFRKRRIRAILPEPDWYASRFPVPPGEEALHDRQEEESSPKIKNRGLAAVTDSTDPPARRARKRPAK